MNDDFHPPIDHAPFGTPEQPLYVPTRLDTPASRSLGAALPVGAFTASVLFDVLALVAESPEQAHRDNDRAANFLKVGLGASLAALALELFDGLNVPPATPAGKSATKRLALDGAVVAVYLLNLAARQKQVARAGSPREVGESAPIGLSLVGLALLAISGKFGFLPGLGAPRESR